MLAALANPHRIKAAHRRRRRVASRVWFPGQYFDSETGLNFNDARDYEATTGLYVEFDPIGLAADKNPYRYALDNPLKYFDAKGENAELAAGAVVILGVCFIIHCEFKARDICTKLHPRWQEDVGEANQRLLCVTKIFKACLTLGSIAVDPIKESITIPMEPREPEPQCEDCK